MKRVLFLLVAVALCLYASAQDTKELRVREGVVINICLRTLVNAENLEQAKKSSYFFNNCIVEKGSSVTVVKTVKIREDGEADKYYYIARYNDRNNNDGLRPYPFYCTDKSFIVISKAFIRVNEDFCAYYDQSREELSSEDARKTIREHIKQLAENGK